MPEDGNIIELIKYYFDKLDNSINEIIKDNKLQEDRIVSLEKEVKNGLKKQIVDEFMLQIKQRRIDKSKLLAWIFGSGGILMAVIAILMNCFQS